MKKLLLVFIVVSIVIFIFLKINHKNEGGSPAVKSNSEIREANAYLLKDYENFQGASVNLFDGWMLYKNEILGFQVEYPSRKFAYGVLKPDEGKFMNTPSMNSEQKPFFYNVSFSDGDSPRIMITMEQSDFNNVDEWFAQEVTHYKFSELGELYYKKIKISNLDAVISYHTAYNPPYSYTITNDEMLKNIAIIKNGILVSILTANLTQEERERIWKSFQFLK